MDDQSNTSLDRVFCMSCGVGLPSHAKFCAGCGESAPALIPNGAASSGAQEESLTSQDEPAQDGKNPPMSLGMAWAIYFGGLGLVYLFIAMG